MGKRSKAIFRIRILTGSVLFIALVVIIRLYQLQVVDHQMYEQKAENQYVHTVNQLYDRGSIYFTTKNGDLVSAATIKSGYVLSVDPTRITDPEGTYQKLNAVFPLDHDSFIKDATLPHRTYVEVDPQVDQDKAAPIKDLKLSGVELYRTQWRYYPGDELAARTIGFVGYSSDPTKGLVGLYGLERYYNDVLERNDKKQSVNFFAEIFSNLSTKLFQSNQSNQGDVVTTIEPTVSRVLEQALQSVQDKYHSEKTGGIIMDPKTGAIYAMGVMPSFNLNDRSGATVQDFENPLVSSVYEMGSIYKALTMAAGLDSGAVTPATTYDDTGCIMTDGSRICNYDFRARGVIPMQQILSQSLNVGASWVEQKMGNTTFTKYFKALKIGDRTGIDLPNEMSGLISNLDSPRNVEHETASFGQGIAMTPMETIRALGTIANDGVLVTPHIAKEIRYDDGRVKELTYPTGPRVFSSAADTTLTRMLVTVADDALANGKVKMEHYSFGSKTGTAQVADPNGGYYKDKFLHSFFVFFPAYNPRFIIFLYTVYPKGVPYASETLTQPIMDITHFLINYYNIPPDR